MFSGVLLFTYAVAALATPQPSKQDNAAAVKNFKFFGINESGPEFGEKNFTGVKNKEASSTPTMT